MTRWLTGDLSMRRLWERIRQGHVPEGAWIDYHENSKTTREMFSAPRSEQDATAWMLALDRRPFAGHDLVTLPPPRPLNAQLGTLLRRRRSSRDLASLDLDPQQLSSLLFAMYGVTERRNDKVELRTVPSAGAMYPLEIIVAIRGGNGLEPGIYTYVPHAHALCLLRPGDGVAAFAECMVEADLVHGAGAVFAIAAVFERTIYKYGERGYRFVLLEAGHVAQNLALAADALGLVSLPYGGAVDRELDTLLGFDGVSASVLYPILVGARASKDRGGSDHSHGHEQPHTPHSTRSTSSESS